MVYPTLVMSLLYLLLSFLPALSQTEDTLGELSVLAIAPLTGQAVVKGSDGRLHRVQRGDKLPGTTATLMQVLPDRLVLEEHVLTPNQMKKKQLAWLFKATWESGNSRLVRLQRNAPAYEPIPNTMTHSTSIPTPNQ